LRWIIRLRTHAEKGSTSNIVLQYSCGSTIALGWTLVRRRNMMMVVMMMMMMIVMMMMMMIVMLNDDDDDDNDVDHHDLLIMMIMIMILMSPLHERGENTVHPSIHHPFYYSLF
jgi:hypothetical protein